MSSPIVEAEAVLCRYGALLYADTSTVGVDGAIAVCDGVGVGAEVAPSPSVRPATGEDVLACVVVSPAPLPAFIASFASGSTKIGPRILSTPITSFNHALASSSNAGGWLGAQSSSPPYTFGMLALSMSVLSAVRARGSLVGLPRIFILSRVPASNQPCETSINGR